MDNTSTILQVTPDDLMKPKASTNTSKPAAETMTRKEIAEHITKSLRRIIGH
jgi:hypothetical protein